MDDLSLGLPTFAKIARNDEPRLMTVQCPHRFKPAGQYRIYSNSLSLLMRPHGMNDYDMLLCINTINKPMLNIDSTRIVSV